MEDLKRRLAAHCDRVAWGAVALIIVILLLVRNLGGDPVKTSSQEIDRHLDAILRLEEEQRIELAAVPKLKAALDGTWAPQRPLGEGGAWLWHRKPALLRVFQEKAVDKAFHAPPILQKVSVLRSPELKRPIVVLEGKTGEVGNVRFTAAEVLRANSPDGTFTKCEVDGVSPAGLGSGSPLRFEDRKLDAVPFNKKRSYAYKLRTVVQLDGRVEPGPDFKPQHESEEIAWEIAIPPDLAIELVTAQERVLVPTPEPGKAWLRVEIWDYAEGRVKKLDMKPYRELMTDKPAESDFIAGTSLYVWVVDSSTQIKLKDWKTKATYPLKAGDAPASVALPEPWERPAAPPQEKAEEKKGKAEATAPEEETPPEAPEEPVAPEEEESPPRKAPTEEDNPFK